MTTHITAQYAGQITTTTSPLPLDACRDDLMDDWEDHGAAFTFRREGHRYVFEQYGAGREHPPTRHVVMEETP